ncbi:DUF4242 domain-containing protein [Marinobacter sp. CAU 1620]|nr:DUF4242 domain-containing protein [Marinobacter arenosus]
MPKYMVERELPGAGKLSTGELQEISRKSCSVLEELGPKIQWLNSFVTEDKVYCLYIAPMRRWSGGTRKWAGFP